MTSTQEHPVYKPVHPLKILLNMAMLFFRAMVGAYGISVTGFLILRLLISEEHWSAIAFFNSFIHLLILPALVLLPIVVLMRRKELILLTVAPFAAFMLWYGGMFFNSAPTIPDDVPRLSMVTFNIAAYRSNLDDFVGLIAEIDADVVLIQELGEPAAQMLTDTFADAYPYQALYPRPGGVHGQGVLSRYPIVEEEAYIPNTSYQQRLLLDVNGEQIVVYNVHIVNPISINFAERRQDVVDLLARVDTERLPVIVGGDFNMTDRSEPYHLMRADYEDAFRSAGRGFGWSFAPIVRRFVGRVAIARIDYVFYSAGIMAGDARVWDRSAGSDHLPVRVELALVDDRERAGS